MRSEPPARAEKSRRASLLRAPAVLSGFLAASAPAYEPPQHNAELFYLLKQIQAQTPMVLVLENGEHVEGCIEWYDRNSIKVRGRNKTLVYKWAIKYMYKVGENG
ncbi:MAG: RNA chaperone Hfq [Terracidiphilus sp.]